MNKQKQSGRQQESEVVIITGLSGSGKGTVLKALEDLGYYSVDNLPVDLIPKFTELTKDSPHTRYAALVVDIREGEPLKRFPEIYTTLRRKVLAQLLFLDADTDALVRRFSETRRPHPLGGEQSVAESVEAEREMLAPIRAGRFHHQYVEVQRSRTSRGHPEQVPRRAGAVADPRARKQLRFQARRPGG